MRSADHRHILNVACNIVHVALHHATPPLKPGGRVGGGARFRVLFPVLWFCGAFAGHYSYIIFRLVDGVCGTAAFGRCSRRGGGLFIGMVGDETVTFVPCGLASSRLSAAYLHRRHGRLLQRRLRVQR